MATGRYGEILRLPASLRLSSGAKLFTQVGEALLQAGKALVFTRVRTFQGGAPLPLALALGAPQAQQVSVIDIGCFVYRVHFGDHCFQYTDQTCRQCVRIVLGTFLGGKMWWVCPVFFAIIVDRSKFC